MKFGKLFLITHQIWSGRKCRKKYERRNDAWSKRFLRCYFQEHGIWKITLLNT